MTIEYERARDYLRARRDNKPVIIWWSPGEPEDDLHGFLSRKERDAHGRGATGPFRRIVRDHHALGPVPFEVRITRAYLDKSRPAR